MFVVSERIVDEAARGGQATAPRSLPARNRARRSTTSTLGCRPGGVLVPVRDYNTLAQLDWMLERAGVRGSRCRRAHGARARPRRHGTPGLERGPDVFRLRADALHASRRDRRAARAQGDAAGRARHEHLRRAGAVGRAAAIEPGRRRRVGGDDAGTTVAFSSARRGIGRRTIRISRRGSWCCARTSSVKRYSLGAHAPDLSSADIERIHHLWVDAVKDIGPDLHHRDVVAAALATLEDQLSGEHRQEAVDRLRRQTSHSV